MKYLILVTVFVAVPYMLLNALVMPTLKSLQNSYAHADTTAERVVQGAAPHLKVQ